MSDDDDDDEEEDEEEGAEEGPGLLGLVGEESDVEVEDYE
jgi:hypothetical protein